MGQRECVCQLTVWGPISAAISATIQPVHDQWVNTAHHRLETDGKPSTRDLLADENTCGKGAVPEIEEEQWRSTQRPAAKL